MLMTSLVAVVAPRTGKIIKNGIFGENLLEMASTKALYKLSCLSKSHTPF